NMVEPEPHLLFGQLHIGAGIHVTSIDPRVSAQCHAHRLRLVQKHLPLADTERYLEEIAPAENGGPALLTIPLFVEDGNPGLARADRHEDAFIAVMALELVGYALLRLIHPSGGFEDPDVLAGAT